MISRMKKDMIALTLEVNDLSESYKEKKSITKQEFEKS